jgi:putative ABC transport system permease protein
MIKNYLKVALRNLTRSKGYSLINVMGLAVGMSVTMLIGMWVHDEVSFNTSHTNYKYIAQVYQHQTINNEINTLAAGPMPVAPELRTTYKNDFKHVVRSWWESNHILSIDDKRISSKGTFMDAEALEMFSFSMLEGSWASLKDPSSMVISEATAKALFANEDPLNKIVRINNVFDVKVTGVYEELPHNSRFHGLQFISTWDFWVASNEWMKASENDWSNNINTFVEIQSNATFDAISSKIKDIKFKRLSKEQADREHPQLFLQPMSRWHLYSEWENGKEVRGRIQFVWLFGTIGLFVLLLACINFMNLSTAQSQQRAKEVGIRKSIGSVRAQLIYQFLTESFLVVVLAFVLALAFVTASLPSFNALADKQMDVLWTNMYFWIISFAFIFFTAMLSGSYPALYLSSFQPVKVLKGTFNAGRFSALPRKALVILQFTVSVALIIGTVIVWQQIQFAKNRPIGYTREGLIMIRKNSQDFWGKSDVLENELKASGAIAAIAESSSPATEVWYNNSNGFSWKGKDPDLQDDFATMAVTHEYGRTMRWNFVQGRDFSREFATDSSAVVLNETAVRVMGLKDPINEEITWNGKKFTVIGVIKDMIMDSPYEPVKQTVFWLSYDGNVWINIRLNPELSTKESLAKVEKVFQGLFPAVPFEYKFTDQEYALKFSGEERIGKLASLFATLAIFISCLGLFGLSSFVAEQRKKEIGIRKILGASVSNLWKMLSAEFVLLVSISCLIAIPFAWYFLEQWLQKYEYHTELSIWIFVLASAGALLITVLTVSFQTIKASMSDPVKSLRSE